MHTQIYVYIVYYYSIKKYTLYGYIIVGNKTTNLKTRRGMNDSPLFHDTPRQFSIHSHESSVST